MGCLLAREIKKLKSAVLVNDSVVTRYYYLTLLILSDIAKYCHML
jgi:hypothetical protein